MKRFTMKELSEKSDAWILYHIVNDKWAKLQNPYTPLAVRLAKMLETLATKAEINNE